MEKEPKKSAADRRAENYAQLGKEAAEALRYLAGAYRDAHSLPGVDYVREIIALAVQAGVDLRVGPIEVGGSTAHRPRN